VIVEIGERRQYGGFEKHYEINAEGLTKAIRRRGRCYIIEIAEQLLDRYSWRPLVAETIGRMSSALDAKSKRELQQLQRAWNNRDETPISEDEAGRMVSRVYALLGID
jgi:chorismate mutase